VTLAIVFPDTNVNPLVGLVCEADVEGLIWAAIDPTNNSLGAVVVVVVPVLDAAVVPVVEAILSKGLDVKPLYSEASAMASVTVFDRLIVTVALAPELTTPYQISESTLTFGTATALLHVTPVSVTPLTVGAGLPRETALTVRTIKSPLAGPLPRVTVNVAELPDVP
jgi:hypothetical protein